MQVTALCLSFLLLQATKQALGHVTAGFVPTSALVDVGRMVARDAGFRIEDDSVYFLDMLETNQSRALRPDFRTIGLYENGDLVLEISVYELTGQLLDTTRCLSFEYPDLRPFADKVRKQTGRAPLTRAQLSSVSGCPTLKPLSTPRDRLR